MIELFVIKESEWYELVTESVTLEGERYQAPRSIEASIVIKQGSHKYYSVQEGDTVLFKWKGKELFRGIVFSRVPKEYTLTFKAYDMLQYLVKNQDVYVFSNKTAADIVKRIANDFQIPKGSIANTGHTIKSLVFKDNTSLYDIILKALRETKSKPEKLSAVCRKRKAVFTSVARTGGYLGFGNGCEHYGLRLQHVNR